MDRECGLMVQADPFRRLVNQVALRHYMHYFDMKGRTLVESFRCVGSLLSKRRAMGEYR